MMPISHNFGGNSLALLGGMHCNAINHLFFLVL